MHRTIKFIITVQYDHEVTIQHMKQRPIQLSRIHTVSFNEQYSRNITIDQDREWETLQFPTG